MGNCQEGSKGNATSWLAGAWWECRSKLVWARSSRVRSRSGRDILCERVVDGWGWISTGGVRHNGTTNRCPGNWSFEVAITKLSNLWLQTLMLAHALSREKTDEARRWPREFTRTPIVTRARVLATRTAVCPRAENNEKGRRGCPGSTPVHHPVSLFSVVPALLLFNAHLFGNPMV